MSGPTPGTIHVGIGGWDYAPWRETFYPPGLPKARQLEHAARAVTAIEINATFYRRQTPESFARWRDATPPGFRFAIKAHRACVSSRRLAERGETIAWFLDQGLTELGDRLGPVLWQFTPTRQFDQDDIAAFLDLLPAELGGVALRHAIEPRHPSFADPAFFALVRARGLAVVLAESRAYPRFDEPTADFVYARLQCAQDELVTGYSEPVLKRWASEAQARAEHGRDVFVFFIGAAKQRNPAAAQALIDLLGH